MRLAGSDTGNAVDAGTAGHDFKLNPLFGEKSLLAGGDFAQHAVGSEPAKLHPHLGNILCQTGRDPNQAVGRCQAAQRGSTHNKTATIHRKNGHELRSLLQCPRLSLSGLSSRHNG
ncbi:hypothetical protein FQZ97_988380 [compost metagenome]